MRGTMSEQKNGIVNPRRYSFQLNQLGGFVKAGAAERRTIDS
jgi:hypothetical protein